MKNIFKYASLLLAAAIAFSCQPPVDGQEPEENGGNNGGVSNCDGGDGSGGGDGGGDGGGGDGVPPTTNKTIRFPNDVVEAVEQAIQGKDCTFSAFVIAAVRAALDDVNGSEE